MIWRVLSVVIVLSLCAPATSSGQPAAATAPPAPTDHDWPQVISAARAKYAVGSTAELKQARATLDQALDRVLAHFAEVPLGGSLRALLEVDVLKAELGRNPPDVTTLARIWRSLWRLTPSNQDAAIAPLRTALADYTHALHLLVDPLASAEALRQLDVLSNAWSRYRTTSSPEDLTQARTAYLALMRIPSAAPEVIAVGRAISFPNQTIAISEQVLQEEIAKKPVKSPLDINDSSKGMRTTGKGEVNGSIKFDTIDSPQIAHVQVGFEGVGESKVTVRKGSKITVLANATLNLHASQPAFLSAAGPSTNPATVGACADTRPYSASLCVRSHLLQNLGSRLVMKVAWKQKPKSDASAAAKAKKQIETILGEKIDAMLTEVHTIIVRLYPPSLDHYMRRLDIFTTDDSLQTAALFALPWQLGAPSPPPSIPGDRPPLVMHIHASAVDNLAMVEAGHKLNEPDFREAVYDTLGLVPGDHEMPQGRIPALLEFAHDQPWKIRLENGKIEFESRVTAFEAGGRRFEGGPWTIRANYTPRLGKDGFEIQRDALSVTPALGEAGSALKSIAPRFFVERAATNPFTTTGSLAKSHNLHVGSMKVADGWLTMVWSRIEPVTATAEASR